MTVRINKPAINLREELASLRNQGGYEEQQFYFDGLVTNGTFDTDTSGWTAEASNTIAVVGGELEVTFNSALFSGASTAYLTPTEVGKVYKLSATARRGTSPSSVIVRMDGPATNQLTFTSTSNETKTGYFVATSSATTLRVMCGSSSGTGTAYFDNISVFEVDANDDVVHRMPKGWVPKDVYEDGLLQREGAANDYEVVYDGFDYYVKPTVAPTATTETCVIGVRV